MAEGNRFGDIAGIWVREVSQLKIGPKTQHQILVLGTEHLEAAGVSSMHSRMSIFRPEDLCNPETGRFLTRDALAALHSSREPRLV